MFLHAAQYLGMDSEKDMKKIRLAMLAWMLPARDHSFYEIMTSATQYGLTDFNTDADMWRAYETPVAPLKIAVNKRAIPEKPPIAGVPRGKFPGWYLSPPGYPVGSRESRYKDLLAQQWLPGSGLMVRSDLEIAPFLTAGVPRGIIEKVNDDVLKKLKQLLALIARARLNDPVAATNDTQFAAVMSTPLVTGLQDPAQLGGNCNIVACALVAKLHPAYPMPATHKPYLMAAKLLTPKAKGERIADDTLAAVDPKTSAALVNPDFGSKGSGKRGADTAYGVNKAKFIEEVLQYQPDKYKKDPDQMNAWFETYGRRLSSAFPGTDLDSLRALNTSRVKAKGTPLEAKLEKAFDDAYQKVFGLQELSEAEKVAINMYSVSSVANSVNAATRGDAAKLAKWGDTAELLISGLEKLPAFSGGPVYRGDANRGFAVGKIIHYQEFVSTAKTVKSSFINKSGMAWATHAVVIENHKSGKDIMAMSDYSSKTLEKMEGEILFPPGVRFVVKRVEDWRNLKNPLADTDRDLKKKTEEIAAKKALGQDVAALEVEKKALQKKRAQIPGDKQLLNKVWVYLDEV